MSEIIKDKTTPFPYIEDLFFEEFASQGGLSAEKEDPVLLKSKAENFLKEAKEGARRIIENAEKKAQDMLDNAGLQIENCRREAFQQGFSDGQKKAESEAEQKYKEIFETELKQLRSIAEAFKDSYLESLKNAERSLVKLALQVAEKIIKQEAEKNEEIVLRMVKEGISRLVEKSKVLVRLHPQQLNFVEKNKRKLLESLGGIDDFSLQQDPRVDLGGCIIETESGSVEVRLDKQIKEINKALTGEDKEDSDVSDHA